MHYTKEWEEFPLLQEGGHQDDTSNCIC